MDGTSALQSEPVRDGEFSLYRSKPRSNVIEVYKLVLVYLFIKSYNS